jgi:hypothetical protein
VKRSGREKRGVSILIALFRASRIDAPAVANDEHHWTSHTSRTLLVNAEADKRFFR